MNRTRGWKYKSFLRYLRFFKYISFSPKRGSFLEYYYVLMRYLDDIVDGDAPLPYGYISESEYIKEKIAFTENMTSPKDEVDQLILYCFKLAEQFGQEFYEETSDILNSLLFDADRRGKHQIFTSQVLYAHFHQLDIRGTIKATLKIFKEDPEKFEILESLGTACRYHYDLEDFNEDIAAGYINIPKEEMDELDISLNDILFNNSSKIDLWLYKHAMEGMELLKKHEEILPSGKFGWLARATFPPVYKWPAQKVFQRTISRIDKTKSISDRP
ncbi:hypothetical protein [uncultured Eudoraea sp.]|uniref:hypothetical protein n=1 Tax=uncultured Eudoraea sp. TaxID=1035614 RepID=UPI00262D5A39|nr:hypothetical protein [uncultured Eudoraea sp.]